MSKDIAGKTDDWAGVRDVRKRKQIQDRLAQRARRERLARQREQSTASLSSSSKPKRQYLAPSYQDCLPTLYQKLHDSHLSSCMEPPSEYQPIELPMLLDHALLPIPNHTVYSALFHNGVILGLACGSASVSKSSPAKPHVPEPLRPTQYQLDTIHFLWIDRFPFPEMRRKMILLSDSLNSEDFLADLFMTPTFSILPGAASWDPSAWHMSTHFKAKWGYLF